MFNRSIIVLAAAAFSIVATTAMSAAQTRNQGPARASLSPPLSTCPPGQIRLQTTGSCAAAPKQIAQKKVTCPEGQVLNAAGKCGPKQCPKGTVATAAGCKKVCTPPKQLNAAGQCL